MTKSAENKAPDEREARLDELQVELRREADRLAAKERELEARERQGHGTAPVAPARRIKTVYSPPRVTPADPELAAAERQGYEQTRDREAEAVHSSVLSALGTLGTPAVWTTVLAVVLPIALGAASRLVKALHADSPGGPLLTRRELRAITNQAADDLQDALWRAFQGRAVDEEE